MSEEEAPVFENAIDFVIKDHKDKIGIISLDSIIIESEPDEILTFLKDHSIIIPKVRTTTRSEYIKYICLNFYNIFQSSLELQSYFGSPLNYIGSELTLDKNIKNYMIKLDFVIKQDLVDIFADFCAKFGAEVFLTREGSERPCDLVLITRKPKARVEGVVLRTGAQMSIIQYKNTLEEIKALQKVMNYSILVTTPLGVLNVGLEQLLHDSKRLKFWLYIVDPERKRIFGVIKGEKSMSVDKRSQEFVVLKLPTPAFRTGSISSTKTTTYAFNEKESYDPSKFIKYELLGEKEHDKLLKSPSEKAKYQEMFKSLILIEHTTELALLAFSSKFAETKEDLLLLFKKEYNPNVKNTVKEVKYNELIAEIISGQFITLMLLLSSPAEQDLKERMLYFLNVFEYSYSDLITMFKETKDESVFNQDKILSVAKKILKI